MTSRVFRRAVFAAVVLTLSLGGCGYRWVRTSGPGSLLLSQLQNSTSEPGLGLLLEEALRNEGGISRSGAAGSSSARLEVIITGFRETAAGGGEGGSPSRETLEMTASWRVRDPSGGLLGEGDARAERPYPWTPDPAALDWARDAARSLLTRDLARALVADVGKVRGRAPGGEEDDPGPP